MKVINKIMFLLFAAVIFISCENKVDQKVGKEAESKAISEAASKDIKTVQLDISGMTCEIGCAKLIQSKLYKTEGVSFAEVRFVDSTGIVSYDANRLTQDDLVKVVEDAGGGDLYRVREVSEMAEPQIEEEKLEGAQ